MVEGSSSPETHPWRQGLRVLLTATVFAVALAATAAVVFLAVLFLAGPHGGALPSFLHGPTLVLGWLVVAAVPILAARWVWRRLAPQHRTKEAVDIPAEARGE